LKIKVFCSLFIYLGVLLNGCAASHSHRDIYGQRAKSQRVAVPDFEVKKNKYANQYAGQAAAAMFVTALQQRGTLSPVDRSILKSALEEQKFQQSGLVDDATMIKMGLLTGADVVAIGCIERISFTTTAPGILISFCEVDISVKLINPRTGRLLFPLLIRTGRSFVGGVPATLRAGDTERHDILGTKRNMTDMTNDAMRNAVEKLSDSIDSFMKD